MRETALTALKAYLWFVAAFHLFVGASVNLSPELTRAIARMYGATTEWAPQFAYALRPLGAFMFSMGLLAVAAALNPARYAAVVYAFVFLFTVRALHRVFFADEIFRLFAVAPERSAVNLWVMLAQAVLLLVLCRVALGRGSGPAAA